MAFSKNEMQDELMEFMQAYAFSVQRLFGEGTGGNIGEKLSNPDLIKKSYLWTALDEMYDFGVQGLRVSGFHEDLMIDGKHADAEVFFNCIASNSMAIYFDEDDVIYPRKCIDTVRIAIARVVLEGGERYTDYGAGEYGLGNGDWGYLTLSEIALLADMDERSVRNAANPKANNPLKTESVGKRSLVTPKEAIRWLADRKGFIPTQKEEFTAIKNITVDVALPKELVDSLTDKAHMAGLSLADYIKSVV